MRYKGKKGKLWDIISKLMRALYTDCYTCPARNLEGRNAQAGHCWPVGHTGSNNTLSWDLNQIRLQCSRCNGAGQGEQAIFKARLAEELGQAAVDEMERRRWKTDPVKNWDTLIEHYSQLLEESARDHDMIEA